MNKRRSSSHCPIGDWRGVSVKVRGQLHCATLFWFLICVFFVIFRLPVALLCKFLEGKKNHLSLSLSVSQVFMFVSLPELINISHVESFVNRIERRVAVYKVQLIRGINPGGGCCCILASPIIVSVPDRLGKQTKQTACQSWSQLLYSDESQNI